MDLLNNPFVLTAIIAAWGLLVRFNPKLKSWPSYIIPYGNLVIALLVKLTAPTDASAAAGPDAIAVAAAGGEVSFWSRIFAAIIQALGNALLYDKFLKAPAIKTLGTTKEKKAHIGTAIALVFGLLLIGSPAEARQRHPKSHHQQEKEPKLARSRLSLGVGVGISTTRSVFTDGEAYRGLVVAEARYRIMDHVGLAVRGSGRPGFGQDRERRAEGLLMLNF